MSCKRSGANIAGALALLIAPLIAAKTVHAQDVRPQNVRPQNVPPQNVRPPAAETPAACLRFTFGKWSPALDWKAAGHVTTLDSAKVDRAPDGRAWAGPAGIASGDTVLVLYPTFWPAGVALSFDARRLQPGDTVTAKATAFVADARVPTPIAAARVWRVACR